MRYSRNTNLIGIARILRKNMTKQERRLWYDFLRYCKPRFRRQEILGNYIADFFCYEAKLVIELDGSQHYAPSEECKDAARTAYFESLGLRVIRFSNTDVDRHFDSVCEEILHILQQCNIAMEIVIE